MTQTRRDLPWNFPADWDAPSFLDGEVPALAMREGERIIGVQRALVMNDVNPAPDPQMLKAGVACYRLGWLFERNRAVILEALRRERARERGREF